MNWSERYPTERDCLDDVPGFLREVGSLLAGPWFEPVPASENRHPNCADGSDIRCERCDSETGCVDLCVTCPMDNKPCNDERCTQDQCAGVITS
jgi:hypothetical protein